MQELITITTGEQGSPVVSARELYEFLGLNKAAFARWAKKNIITNAYAREGEDWQGVNIMLNGNEARDYGLTLDFAKRLSMVARTEKGEEARRYFLDCEKRLAAPVATTTEQVLIQLITQSNQLLANQQQQLEQLRADVEQIKAGAGPNRITSDRQTGKAASRLKATPKLPLPSGPPTNKVRLTPMRSLIHQKVNDYCQRHEVGQGETYNYLYRRLNDVYGVNVYRLIRANNESLLDTLERYGHLDWLYSLIMGELVYTE